MADTKHQGLSDVNEMSSRPQLEFEEAQKVDARQADIAATYLNNTEQYDPVSPEEFKKIKRRTDWILLPMVCAIERDTLIGLT